MNKMEKLDDLIETLSHARQGLDILQDVYLEAGGYEKKLSPELVEKINNFMGFDDGE